jgi:peptidoglycan/xylan/chitin deacetylase (PgdA/CDA1 family)
LAQGLQAGSLPKRAVAVTFDDGYADIADHAMPLLERYQIPATVFVATGYIGREFWWDELERLVLSPAILPDRLCLTVNGSTLEWPVDDPDDLTPKKGETSPRQRLLRSLYGLLLTLSYKERRKALKCLRAWAGSESHNAPYPRALTRGELIELARGGLVEIGAHTVTHPVLTELPTAAQRVEIRGSKAYLEELLGQPVTSFSYPNGASSDETLTIVRDAGFSSACASSHGVVWRGTGPFQLPRFWIQDWDGAMFSRWLRRWLRG